MTPIWDMLMTGVITQEILYTFVIYLVIFVAQLIIALLSYPIAIRLSAELYKQVLKYKQIVRDNKYDDDVVQYIAYYNHFKVIYCLLLSLILHITYTIITSVNGAYMLYLYNELNEDAYLHGIPTTANIINHQQEYYDLKYLSVPTNNYVLYTIEAGRCLAHDCVLMFAALFVYQVVCYFQRLEFSLCFFLKILIIRVIYVIFWNTNLIYWITNSILPSQASTDTHSLIFSLYLPFPLVKRFIQLFENGLLTGVSFTLVSVAMRIIKEKEISHQADMRMIREIGNEQYQRVALSIKLFRVFSIGFIITVLIRFVTNVFDCHFIFLFGSLDKNYDVGKFQNTQIVVGIITGLIGLLTPVLYILFMWKLWFFFGNIFRKNKYRFRYEDFRTLGPAPINQLNTPHHVKLPNEGRIILTHHIVIVLISSLLISALCSQFLGLRHTTPITLNTGDYILTNKTEQALECDGWLEYSFDYSPTTPLDPIPFHNRVSYKNESCLDSIHFYTSPITIRYIDQRVKIDNTSLIYYTDLWLPFGSYIHNISECVYRMSLEEFPIPFPCYIPVEKMYTQQPDKLCHKYYNYLSHPCPNRFDINNTICQGTKSKCQISNDSIVYISINENKNCPNPTLNLSFNRPVVEGSDLSEMCTLRNVSKCDSDRLLAITNQIEDIHFTNNDLNGISKTVCLFTAKCHYPLWIPLLACISILLFFLLYASICLLLIHRYLS